MGNAKRKKALLIIDVQNDFCPGGKLSVPEGEAVVPVINSLSRGFDKVIATQDWHPPGHVSFKLWPDHCIAGSTGADFHPGLDLKPVDLIIRKGTSPGLDSYSAFFENDRKTVTGLASYLSGLAIHDVYLAGLAADVCVYYSALDAIRLGLKVTLLVDAARGIDTPPGTLKDKLEEMERLGVVLLNSKELT